MVVKILPCRHPRTDRDQSGCIDYLLNERVEQGTAQVLAGDALLSKRLIQSMDTKHKVFFCCLSFQEPATNIAEDRQKELMQSFERALLTEQMRGRYNSLWVRHTDKGRLELNLVIPKVDLVSGWAFNPCWHKADLRRIEVWQDMINLKHGFSNPKDPQRARSMGSIDAKTPQGRKVAHWVQGLHAHLMHAVDRGELNSKRQVLEWLKSQNIDIIHNGKSHITLRCPQFRKAFSLKGAIYDERFVDRVMLEVLIKKSRCTLSKTCWLAKQAQLERLIAHKRVYYARAQHRSSYCSKRAPVSFYSQDLQECGETRTPRCDFRNHLDIEIGQYKAILSSRARIEKNTKSKTNLKLGNSLTGMLRYVKKTQKI